MEIVPTLILDTPDCVASHLGLWCVDVGFAQQFMSLYTSGALSRPRADVQEPGPAVARRPAARRKGKERAYEMLDGEIALLPVQGMMMRQASKFGGVSTVDLRRALRDAMHDPEITGMLMAFDSPGGMFDGTYELALDIAAFRDSGKPIHAYADVCASAAYWCASQTSHITASPVASLGSIGVITTLTDTSGALEFNRIKVHVVTTGRYKAVGLSGVPVTEEVLEYMMGQISSRYAFFEQAVMAGRSLSAARMAAVSDGAVYLGEEAKALGLVDVVGSIDVALEMLRAKIVETRSRGKTAQRAVGSRSVAEAREQLAAYRAPLVMRA